MPPAEVREEPFSQPGSSVDVACMPVDVALVLGSMDVTCVPMDAEPVLGPVDVACMPVDVVCLRVGEYDMLSS